MSDSTDNTAEEDQISTVDEELEPSTEKEPGEEPKAASHDDDPEPSHIAQGIGVIGGPATEVEDT